MKNKKLFAILTLVCFMMTLMPVAAFAAETVATTTSATGTSVKVDFTSFAPNAEFVWGYTTTAVDADATADDNLAGATIKTFTTDATGAATVTVSSADIADGDIVFAAPKGTEAKANQNVLAVAAAISDIKTKQDAAINYETSIFVATNGSSKVEVGDKVSYTIKLKDVYGADLNVADGAVITIWAEEVSKPGIATSALIIDEADFAAAANINTPAETLVTDIANSYDILVAEALGYNDTVKLSFARPGEYKVFATATATAPQTGDVSTTVAGVIKLAQVGDVITVTGSGTTIPQEHYTATATVTADVAGIHLNGNTTALTPATPTQSTANVAEGHSLATISGLAANNIGDVTVKVEFDSKGYDLTGKTIAISTNSANLIVSKETATTNALGAINFGLSAAREGNYKVYLTVDGCTWTIDVVCGNTAATYIAVAEAPTALVPLYGTVNENLPTSGDLNIQVLATDINGNAVTNNNGLANAIANTDGKYVSFVNQPAASKLDSEDLHLKNVGNGKYLLACPTLDAEGAYEVKIVLDNGNFVTVPFTVKEFQTPVRLILAYPQSSIELGGKLAIGKLAYMDANGVMKAATTPELAATGYAIADFKPYDANYLITGVDNNGIPNAWKDGIGVVTAKSDEKYVGSTITVTAVDDRYDLIATATLTVADEAAGLAFENNTVEVNVNNKVTVNVVDAKGNKVALGANTNAASTNISYVVLDKPEGAKVSVYTADSSKLMVQGQFVMALTADTVGTVKVQAVVKLTKATAGVGAMGSDVNQVKYYTGVQEFAVGTGETGKSVVMSIGSNELIVGSKVEKMDAKPMIQDNRTFVPFRALAEAFGATVAYDQATSSVTAELNGVKVVMTVGAPVYTVNGVEKTADVAPFISDSRTFVPVRFAAEAFGIEVVPTYNTDGSVADVLFNM